MEYIRSLHFTKKVALRLFVFFLCYTFFWLFIANMLPFWQKKTSLPQQVSKPFSVLGISNQEKPSEELTSPVDQITSGSIIPSSYSIIMPNRKQKFNLSCEFAAAAAVVYHFSANPTFAPANQESAERLLVEKVSISQNPNLGIRMGVGDSDDISSLYKNLNKGFGGDTYYGIHAPPFVDLFAEYGLKTSFITPSENFPYAMQKALYDGHLIMAWIRIGYGKPIDVELSYGSVPVVRGEHVVVVIGYDAQGFVVMDPGSGQKRTITYKNFLEAIQPFSLPLLEVYAASNTLNSSVEEVVSFGNITGLLRSNLTLSVLNGTRKVGVAHEAIEILRNFGYNIVSMGNADNFSYEGITLFIKPAKKDYTYLLKKDFAVSSYTVASVAADLSEDSPTDAIIIVGE